MISNGSRVSFWKGLKKRFPALAHCWTCYNIVEIDNAGTPSDAELQDVAGEWDIRRNSNNAITLSAFPNPMAAITGHTATAGTRQIFTYPDKNDCMLILVGERASTSKVLGIGDTILSDGIAVRTGVGRNGVVSPQGNFSSGNINPMELGDIPVGTASTPSVAGVTVDWANTAANVFYTDETTGVITVDAGTNPSGKTADLTAGLSSTSDKVSLLSAPGQDMIAGYFMIFTTGLPATWQADIEWMHDNMYKGLPPNWAGVK